MKALIKKKFNVFIVDDLSTGYKRLINKKAKFFKININQQQRVNEIIKKK